MRSSILSVPFFLGAASRPLLSTRMVVDGSSLYS
jgi:hypothetical protein